MRPVQPDILGAANDNSKQLSRGSATILLRNRLASRNFEVGPISRLYLTKK